MLLGANPELKEIKMSDMKIIGPTSLRKKVLIKANSQMVSTRSELQSVFNDLKCAKCVRCMERAIKANTKHTHITKIKPNTQEIENDIIVSYYQYKPPRNKRNTENIATKAITNQTTPNRTPNPLKRNKTVTVTKYNNDGQIYAVKIQEGYLVDGEDTGAVATCEVYSVKKYFPCNSLAGELMLTSAKRKVHKRLKKVQEKKTTLTTTERAIYQTQSKAAKRQVDNSQLPENMMTSIEELY